ncbi:hypothetical protein, partial [Candidatus Frankia alpina]
MAVVGGDPTGRELLATLRAEGVDTANDGGPSPPRWRSVPTRRHRSAWCSPTRTAAPPPGLVGAAVEAGLAAAAWTVRHPGALDALPHLGDSAGWVPDEQTSPAT